MKKALFLFLFSLVIPFTSSCGKNDDYPVSSGTSGEGYSTVSPTDLNGKTFYRYYPKDNEIRIPGVETFPYEYTIPEGVNAGTYASFYFLTIKEGKVYWSSTDFETKGNKVTYNLHEEECPLIVINGRYFLQFNGSESEIIFTNDLILLENSLFITEEYSKEKESFIFSFETQHNNWLYGTVANKVNQDLYLNVIKTLSNENQTVTLPSKADVTFNEVNYEVAIQYKLSETQAFELNGYELTAKAFDQITLDFSAKLGFPQYNCFITRYHHVNLYF